MINFDFALIGNRQRNIFAVASFICKPKLFTLFAYKLSCNLFIRKLNKRTVIAYSNPAAARADLIPFFVKRG